MATNVSPESESGDVQQGAAYDQRELIRRRPEEIYERIAKIPGRDIENWTEARTGNPE
jgi:hypothetical protein